MHISSEKDIINRYADILRSCLRLSRKMCYSTLHVHVWHSFILNSILTALTSTTEYMHYYAVVGSILLTAYVVYHLHSSALKAALFRPAEFLIRLNAEVTVEVSAGGGGGGQRRHFLLFYFGIHLRRGQTKLWQGGTMQKRMYYYTVYVVYAATVLRYEEQQIRERNRRSGFS